MELKIGDIVKINGDEALYGTVVKNPDKEKVQVRIDGPDGKRARIFAREALTLMPPLHISTEDLRALIRRDILFMDFMKQAEPYDNYVIDGDYRFTLDDIEAALISLKDTNATFEDFCDGWLGALYYSDDFDEALHIFELYESEDTEGKLPEDDEEMLCAVLAELMAYLDDYWPDEDDKFRKEDTLKEAGEEIRLYRENQGKSKEEWQYTDAQMKDFLRYWDDNGRLKKADGEIVETFRRFVNILCDREDEEALKIKAYSCYGGNAAFEQNWFTSRDCLLKHFEKTGNIFTANTLGYIYYYGRCNGGVPQYEEAFKYFSIGAAGLVYESQYKLADMFRNGYGVPKIPEAAANLYCSVYEDNLKRFRNGDFKCKFADAALRMALAARDGILQTEFGMEYFYLLQADFAIRRRVAECDYYGDNVVYRNIEEALEKARNEYHETVKKHNTLHYGGPYPLGFITERGKRRAKLTVRELTGGKLKLTASVLRNPDEHHPPRALLVLPEADYCGLVDKMSITALDASGFTAYTDGDIVFNDIRYDYETGEYAFYFYDTKTAGIIADDFVMKVAAEKHKEGTELRFVSIRFHEGGRLYDYLCDDESVQEGDRVIVNGYDGETEVEVVKVVKRFEDENGLPYERYKKIVRKAD